MKKLLTIALGLLAGCTVIQPIVQTTRPYEGHFYDKTSVEAAVQSAYEMSMLTPTINPNEKPDDKQVVAPAGTVKAIDPKEVA